MAFLQAQSACGRHRLNAAGGRYTLAASAQPCAMCYGASFWAGIDELLIGARLASGHELTCVAHINHLMMSEVKDAFFVPDSIDHVVSVAAERNTDPDNSFADMSCADARAWIQHGLDHPPFDDA